MTQENLKIGVVGVGGIWKTHAKNLAAIGGNQIVAVCDLSEPNRTAAAEEFGANAYDNVEAMFTAETLDAVISCTPPVARRSVAEAAVAHKVPLLVEKPPASSLDDARAIIKAVQAGSTPVVCGFMYRYLPIVQRMKQLLAGRTVALVQSSFFCPAATEWPLPAWFYIKERSGGHILDQAVHSIDLVRYLVGDIKQVHTYGSNLTRPKAEDFTIEDSSSTNLLFTNGAVGAHVHSWAHSKMTVAVAVAGIDFHLRLDLDERLTGFVGDQEINEQLAAIPEGGVSHHYAEMQSFLESVRSGDFSKLYSPYADAAKSLATVLAMNESIDRGAPVDVESVED